MRRVSWVVNVLKALIWGPRHGSAVAEWVEHATDFGDVDLEPPLALTVVGAYGVVAFGVGWVGLVLGLAGSAAGAPLLARFVYATSVREPATYAAVAAALAVVAAAAAYLPARRAAASDPVSVLRADRGRRTNWGWRAAATGGKDSASLVEMPNASAPCVMSAGPYCRPRRRARAVAEFRAR